ncbi:MAG: gamma-butyrobetaine dioxygenase, partial [Gammaproteobacteria bacterium]
MSTKNLKIDNQRRLLSIVWSDGHESLYPYIWLRHECFFPAIGRPEQDSDSHCLNLDNPADLHLIGHELVGDELILKWANDKNTTKHSLKDLRLGCLSGSERQKRRLYPVHWNKADSDHFKWFEPADFEDTNRLLSIFKTVRDYGIALVRGLPTDPGTVVNLAQNFGPIRVTHFGSLFDIRSQPDDRTGSGSNIGATQSNAQAPHIDETWRQNMPGISFFHCIKPDPGGQGASVYIDGFAAAERIRANDPEAFKFLTTVPILFAAMRNEHEQFRSRARAIVTDNEGIVRGVRIADRTLPALDIPLEQIEPGYKALASIRREFYDFSYAFERVLQPGECVIFDNHRVLHTRRAFNRNAGERWLQQVSVDRDEFQSGLQCLARSLDDFAEAEIEQDSGA